MKKALFLTICVVILAACPVFASFVLHCDSAADTSNIFINWSDSGWPTYDFYSNGTVTLAINGTVQETGTGCIQAYVTLTSAAGGQTSWEFSPGFIAEGDGDTVFTCYEMQSSANGTYANWFQTFIANSGYGWVGTDAFWAGTNLNGWVACTSIDPDPSTDTPYQGIGLAVQFNAPGALPESDMFFIDEITYGNGIPVLGLNDWSLYADVKDAVKQ